VIGKTKPAQDAQLWTRTLICRTEKSALQLAHEFPARAALATKMKGQMKLAAIFGTASAVLLMLTSIHRYSSKDYDRIYTIASTDPADSTSILEPALNHPATTQLPNQGNLVPPTVLPPSPGFPDFNGASAVIARHAKIQTSPTDLEEQKMESRGSFSVLMARAGVADEGEVSLAIWGPNTPFKCTIRGYRKLSGDFDGNTVATGYKKVFQGVRKITTGLLSPGVMGEYDIMSCRSSPGEVQYFRINYDS
jgi:hypothetical protein